MHFYNENEPHAAAWLRSLIAAGELPQGVVDERSICDIQPDELTGFVQCHFFAGIGGWPLALRMAGWPEGRPCWTGSCPCQPFSAAGKRGGSSDERHLWPAFFRLIEAVKPVVIFGEQVASADVLGKVGGSAAGATPVWIDAVFDDLERASYTCGACDLPAASVGADHIRQRLFWVAHSDGGLACDRELQRSRQHRQRAEDGGTGERVEHAASDGRGERRTESGGRGIAGGCGSNGLAVADSIGHDGREDSAFPCESEQHHEVEASGERRGMGNADDWRDAAAILCSDGKYRRVPAGSQPVVFGVADGLSVDMDLLRIAGEAWPLTAEKIEGRVGLLRGYGNAIVPQVAAEFVAAFMDV